PRERALQLAKAVKDLPGPVYLHCHHGQHRGPAAAAAVRLCLDGQYTAGQAEAFLRTAGTDPRYKGLVGLPRTLQRPTAEEVDRAAGDFPEVAKVSDLAQLMVEVDARYERLKLAQKAGWRQPPAHPDVDPAHEATLLAEQYQEAARLAASARPEEFRRSLLEAQGQ